MITDEVTPQKARALAKHFGCEHHPKIDPLDDERDIAIKKLRPGAKVRFWDGSWIRGLMAPHIPGVFIGIKEGRAVVHGDNLAQIVSLGRVEPVR